MLNFEFQGNRKLRDEITSSRLNAILSELRRVRPVAGLGINVQQESNGTRISVVNESTGALSSSTAAERHPFQIISEADPEAEEGSYLVSVRPGTINNLIPSGIFDGETLAKTEVGDSIEYVVAQMETDGRQVVSGSVSLQSEAPGAQTPVIFGLPESFDVLLGIVKGRSVFQIVKDNIVWSGKQQFVTQKTSPPSVGELPYEIYYVWG